MTTGSAPPRQKRQAVVAPAGVFRAAGFSMVELMIAIMILGIGLVMVATIFPVGLEITRETVQKSITLGAVDAAVDTLKLKVPTSHDTIVSAANVETLMIPAALVRPDDPHVPKGDPLTNYGIENDTNITVPESEILPPPETNMVPGRWIDSANGDPLPDLNVLSNAGFITRMARAYTERSFWPGDPPPPVLGPLRLTVALGLRPQNVPVDYRERAGDSPDIELPVIVTDAIPRINIADPHPTSPPTNYLTDIVPDPTNRPARLRLNEHVYPEIALDDSLAARFGLTTADLHANLVQRPDTTERRDADAILANAAAETRRYNWTVFQHRTALSGTRRSFLLNVVVTYRSELGARYARQRDTWDTQFQSLLFYLPDGVWAAPPNPPGGALNGVIDRLLVPEPTTQNEISDKPTLPSTLPDYDYYDYQDTLFPRPWLVMFYSVDPAAGEVRCSAEVARLLPAGSMFIVARTPLVGGLPTVADGIGFSAGTPHRILSSTWTRQQLGNTPAITGIANNEHRLATLQISRSNGSATPLYFVPVYIFPPAILRHPSGGNNDFGEFASRTPVISASMREVTVP